MLATFCIKTLFLIPRYLFKQHAEVFPITSAIDLNTPYLYSTHKQSELIINSCSFKIKL